MFAFCMISAALWRPMPKMYVRPTSTFLSRGRSTPEMRAMCGLALTLLVLGVALADDSRHAVALDHFAVLADRLHAGANFHCTTVTRDVFFVEQPLTVAVAIT